MPLERVIGTPVPNTIGCFPELLQHGEVVLVAPVVPVGRLAELMKSTALETECGLTETLENMLIHAPKAPADYQVESWLVDTGCGYGLDPGNQSHVMGRGTTKAKDLKFFNSANGATRADEVVILEIVGVGESTSHYIIESTPAVLSVGCRRMKLGYSLVWPNGRTPYYVLLPDERNLPCEN